MFFRFKTEFKLQFKLQFNFKLSNNKKNDFFPPPRL